MVRDASAHRLQRREQPSPVLLVIEQAVDLPPVSRVRVLLLAQDVVERVSHGHDHGRDGRPPPPIALEGSLDLAVLARQMRRMQACARRSSDLFPPPLPTSPGFLVPVYLCPRGATIRVWKTRANQKQIRLNGKMVGARWGLRAAPGANQYRQQGARRRRGRWAASFAGSLRSACRCGRSRAPWPPAAAPLS